MTPNEIADLLDRFIDAKNSGRLDAEHLANLLFEHLDDETLASIAADYFA